MNLSLKWQIFHVRSSQIKTIPHPCNLTSDFVARWFHPPSYVKKDEIDMLFDFLKKGLSVQKIKVGDCVAIPFILSCKHCAKCKVDKHTVCLE